MVMKIERGDKGDGRGRGSGVASFSSSLTACPFILVLKMLVILKLFFFPKYTSSFKLASCFFLYKFAWATDKMQGSHEWKRERER